MGRTPDSNTERLNKLYEEREILAKRLTALSELNPVSMNIDAIRKVLDKLEKNQAEIDNFEDL